MNDMIRAEREKILSRKSTKILFFMGLILITVYFFFFQFQYSSIFYNYDTGAMDTVSGFEEIEQRKETASIFEGELAQNTLTLMQQTIDAAKRETSGKDENTQFSAIHVYRDQAAILEYLTNMDGSQKSLEEAYKNEQPIVLGYCDGWDKIISGMGSILAVFMCLFIVISLSPVFAEEYAYHTDSVIYAARYGKTKLVKAKIIASLEIMICIYAIFLLFTVVLYGAVYGLQGGTVSIQSSLHFASSAYHLTFLQLFGISVVLNIIGMIALATITLFLSAQMSSPVTALILSCFVCFMPVLFDFNDTAPMLQKVQEICPIFMLHVNGIFTMTKTYMGIQQPIIMTVFNLALILLFASFLKEVSAKHQVVG